eukprot:TRINITY_DN289_c0_g1_i12.p3 TRINITY_DN289_c0_g1~~TRINITY_DN289_c0_g1_i12.p3  ORF type:complete len:110 (+),score=19.17 TRINITY_DN289_c0_g1_i12:871-1200(+)
MPEVDDQRSEATKIVGMLRDKELVSRLPLCLTWFRDVVLSVADVRDLVCQSSVVILYWKQHVLQTFCEHEEAPGKKSEEDCVAGERTIGIQLPADCSFGEISFIGEDEE